MARGGSDRERSHGSASGGNTVAHSTPAIWWRPDATYDSIITGEIRARAAGEAASFFLEDTHALCLRADRAWPRRGRADKDQRADLGRVSARRHRVPHRDAGKTAARNAENQSRQHSLPGNRGFSGHGFPGDLRHEG